MIKEQLLISIMEISMLLVFISFIFYLSLGIYTKIRLYFSKSNANEVYS